MTYICVTKRSKMVLAKNELFDQQEQHCSGLFKALGHPARIKILKYLAATKTCISGDISKELPLGRTTVNQHLQELKRAGLIQGHISGRKTNYCLDPAGVKALKQATNRLLAEIDIVENLNCE